MTAEVEPAFVGKTVGGFHLLKEIGRGGMGVVYKAHAPDGGVVAVKILPPHLAERPIMRQRFLQEAELAQRLDHPNLVKAIGVGDEQGAIFFAMEYVDGESVAQYLERKGAISEKVAVWIIIGVARALHTAHREGLIHRDVKPENVLLSRKGHVKLADLGLAKDLENDLQLTKADRGVGTPASMAPEQFRDARNVDLRCDVYGLGYVLYVMVTAQLPFIATTSVDVFLRKRDEDYIRPQKLAPTLSARTAQVIEAALAAEPDRRPATAREFAELLLGEGKLPGLPTVRPLSGAPPAVARPDSVNSRNVRPASVSRPSRSLRDTFDDLADLMRKTQPKESCSAVKYEFQSNPWIWIEPGLLWRVGLAAGALALVGAMLTFFWRSLP